MVSTGLFKWSEKALPFFLLIAFFPRITFNSSDLTFSVLKISYLCSCIIKGKNSLNKIVNYEIHRTGTFG
jgi:hypothetical protein